MRSYNRPLTTETVIIQFYCFSDEKYLQIFTFLISLIEERDLHSTFVQNKGHFKPCLCIQEDPVIIRWSGPAVLVGGGERKGVPKV